MYIYIYIYIYIYLLHTLELALQEAVPLSAVNAQLPQCLPLLLEFEPQRRYGGVQARYEYEALGYKCMRP